MAILKNISSATTTTLIAKSSTTSGNINKILISNNSANAATGIAVNLFDEDSTNYYFIKNVTIPSGASLVLDDNLRFDSSRFSLRITNAGTSPDISVIIK